MVHVSGEKREGIVFFSSLEVTLGNKSTASSSPSSIEGVHVEEMGMKVSVISLRETVCSKEN